jgi:hypothetical protein
VSQDQKQNQDEDGADERLARAILALPREVEAPPSLWAGVEARIAAKRRRALVVRRSVTGASMLLAAAAVILSVRFASHPTSSGPQASCAPSPVTSEALPPVAVPVSPPPPVMLVPEEASYVAAVSALESSLHDRRQELPAKDAAAVGASLRALDAAISTTRASLAAHPEDADLRGELDAEYEQKIDAMNDVLEWTTRS